MNVTKLWQERKWLFFLLLPVVLVVVFKDLLIKWNASRIGKTMDKAEEKSKKLEKSQEQLMVEAIKSEAQAQIIKERIEESEKRIKEKKASDIPLDWHKK